MAESWSEKDKRQYAHILSGERQRGKSRARAKEIAARTVNKHRREEERTPNKTSQGTGNPGVSLEGRSVQELRNRARELHITGRSGMRKDELIREIRSHS